MPNRRTQHMLSNRDKPWPRARAFLILVSLLLMLSACTSVNLGSSSDPPSITLLGLSTPYARAISLQSSGNCMQAVPLFLQVIVDDGPAVNVYASLAGCYAALGSPKAALRVWDSAVSLDPTNFGLYLSRSAAEAGLGDNNAARRDARKALRLAKPQVPSYLSIAQAYGAAQDYNGAIAVMGQAIVLVPNNSSLYETRAGLYLNNLKDTRRAYADYRDAIQVAPYGQARAKVYDDFAKVYAQQQDYPNAYATIAMATQLDSSNATYYFDSAELHRQGGAYVQALNLYDKALMSSPSASLASSINKSRGDTYVALNDSRNALISYRKALALTTDPNAKAQLKATIASIQTHG